MRVESPEGELVDNALSWEAQGEAVRRINSEYLTHLEDRVVNGQYSDEDLEMLSKISTIARTWRAAERGLEGDGEAKEKIADDVLMRKVKP